MPAPSPVFGLAAAGAAVVHVAQHFLGVEQNLVAPLALDVRDKADAARIVLERGIVEPVLRRQRRRNLAVLFVLLMHAKCLRTGER